MISSTYFRIISVYISCLILPAWSQTNQSTMPVLEELQVYGESGKTDVATKLELTIMETPQTITSISRQQIDDFALTNIASVLDYSPGLTVEEVETDRTYYTARGFDIVNFQYDGVGIPFISGLNLGQQDTAIYQRVEVVKGAAGLITGLANPSATINYVRKRPTEELYASTSISLEQWQGKRLDGDISGAISSHVNGRVVVAYDDGESYLDRHKDQTRLAYGVLDFNFTDSSKLTIGHSYDNSYSTGVLWGALPLLYSDGTRTDYKVSTSTAPEWTYADNEQQQTFLEFTQTLTKGWRFNAHLIQNTGTYDSELFYVYGAPDPKTEIGLYGWSSAYKRDEEQNNAELFLNGDLNLWGRAHQVVFGYSYSDTQLREKSSSDLNNGFPVLGADWAEGNTPAMVFDSHDPETQASDVDITQEAVYLATRWNILDNAAVLLGARSTKLEQAGISYGGEANADANETVPYFGLTWELFDSLMVYGSYSEVFKQQTWVNSDLKPLGPTIGDSSEVGIKKSFNNERATLSLARFTSNQENFGVFIERVADIAVYEGQMLESSGYELEFSGELTDGLNIGAGYTYVDIRDENGDDARVFIPSRLLKLSATYAFPSMPKLRIGGIAKWQDDITTADKRVEQGAYTLVDLAFHYQISDSVGASINIGNVTNEKYINSLYWDQGYYGTPRKLSASVRWKY
ncbi:outer-membrane receptor for ferric coprogen and ferric-rhodotorulic acid [Alteromonadaceae bacterium Bs31]|nr:outer-membrane receptor for ferric coprogen and ferric-rhodotorulic acid [Alteromonadaceae bacterium Bs31]